MGLEDMYSQNEKKDPTEVPSYFLSAAIDAGIDYATSAVADVGNWVGDGLSAVVDYGADAFTSAVDWGGDALSSLYGGADKLVGGLLPGGQAFGDGYLANLYTGADKMVGGYLPNIGGGAAMGGAGYTPQYMQAQAAFNALPGPAVAHSGAHTLSPAAIQSQFDALPGVGAKKSAFGSLFDGGMSWDKAGDIAKVAQVGMGIYGLTQKPQSGSNKQQYNRLMQQPGLGTMNNGNGGGGGVRNDPAMRNSPVGGGNVPLTTSATGPGGLNDPKSFDASIGKLNKSIEKLNNQVDPSGGTRNPTREANDEGLGIVAPTTPQARGPAPSVASFANVTKGMPPAPGRPIEQYSNNDVTSLVRDSYTNNAPYSNAASPVMSTYTNNAPVVNAISPVMRRSSQFPVAPDASNAIIDTPSQRTASVVQNVQQPQSPAQQGIRVQVEQLNRMLRETDPSSPRFQEILAARNQFQQQLIAAR